MPGFTTHYFFGKNTYRQMEDSEKRRLLAAHDPAYCLGLQGPDIFFYYLPAYFLHSKNVGNVMHTEGVMDFFAALFDAAAEWNGPASCRIVDTYICGFMGHYTLDTLCHPYVFFRVHHAKNKDRFLYDFGNHIHLETDIDKAVLWHFQSMPPSHFRPEETIRLTPEEEDVISRLLEKTISKVYPRNRISADHIRKAIHSIERENRWMHDPAGLKKRGVRAVEQLILGHSFISSMIPSDTLTFYRDPCNTSHRTWCNPWDGSQKSSKSVFDLMDEAAPILLRRMDLYLALRTDKKTNENRYYQSVNQLLSDLGDCSYNSGFPL